MNKKALNFNLYKAFKIFMMIFLLLFILPKMEDATEIKIIGGNTPTVTNSQGVDVTHDQELDHYQYYNVNYQWSVPNGIQIHNGDTATFNVPSNIQVLYDTSFPIYDSNHNEVGVFTIKAGSETGTIVFNNYFEEHYITQNIHGSLTFSGVGKHTYNYKNWVVNKSGWITSHKQPEWDIVYNPDGKDLKDITIKDELTGPQILNSQSIQIQYGTVDENDQFHMEGILSPDQYQLSTSDSGFQLKFDHLNTAIQIIYNTNIQGHHSTGSISNGVSTSDSQFGENQDIASIQVSGNGSASGNIAPSETSSSNTSINSNENTTSSEARTTNTSINSNENTTSSEASTTDTNINSNENTTASESRTTNTSINSVENTTSNEASTTDTSINSNENNTSSESRTTDTSINSTENNTSSESRTTDTSINSNENTTSGENSTASTSINSNENTTSSESRTTSTSINSDENTTASENNTDSTNKNSKNSNNNIVVSPYNNHSSSNTTNTSQSKNNGWSLPKTGDKSNKALIIIGILIILIMIIIEIYTHKKIRNK